MERDHPPGTQRVDVPGPTGGFTASSTRPALRVRVVSGGGGGADDDDYEGSMMTEEALNLYGESLMSQIQAGGYKLDEVIEQYTKFSRQCVDYIGIYDKAFRQTLVLESIKISCKLPDDPLNENNQEQWLAVIPETIGQFLPLRAGDQWTTFDSTCLEIKDLD